MQTPHRKNKNVCSFKTMDLNTHNKTNEHKGSEVYKMTKDASVRVILSYFIALLFKLKYSPEQFMLKYCVLCTSLTIQDQAE